MACDQEGAQSNRTMKARDFQARTIKAALKSLTDKSGSRRFLVADEVGLGKTVVASGVIQGMQALMASRPIKVMYVCANLVIARQNVKRLLGFLPDEEQRNQALAEIDRPSLLVSGEPPNHQKVHVYSLTPVTSVPTLRGQRMDGKLEERAVALFLVQEMMRRRNGRRINHDNMLAAFKGAAKKESLNERVEHQQLNITSEYQNRFEASLAELLRGDLVEAVKSHVKDASLHAKLVGACRVAMTEAALKSIKPDLVIFDEFQRFRDLLDEDEGNETAEEGRAAVDETGYDRNHATSSVLKALRGQGRGGDGPALLLLSATPYGLPGGAAKSTEGKEHHQDFFDLLAFLALDKRRLGEIKEAYHELHSLLMDWAPGKSEVVEAAKICRTQLEEKLRPLMARTERVSSSDILQLEALGSNASSFCTNEVTQEIRADDLTPLVDMLGSFKEDHRPWAMPLWQSVPLPMQTLGAHYLAWKSRRSATVTVHLDEATRQKYGGPKEWPHPRLRSLIDAVSIPDLALPWVAPSLPWWPLEGQWARSGEDDSKIQDKVLVFSRFKAVPSALSGLLSYELERKLSIQGEKGPLRYELVNKRTRFRGDEDHPGLLCAFHPSSFLAMLDPLADSKDLPDRLKGIHRAKQVIRMQLREWLKEHDVKVVNEQRRASWRRRWRDWELVVAMEQLQAKGVETPAKAAWLRHCSSPDRSKELSSLIKRWFDEPFLLYGVIDEVELNGLIQLAISSPAVVALRALYRHWPKAMDEGELHHTIDLCWSGLRRYLDTAWFEAAITRDKRRRYMTSVMEAVVHGNLESVLDEHFWFLSQATGEWHEKLAELTAALSLRDVNVTLHSNPGDVANDSQFKLRCHVAVPLGAAVQRSDTEGADRQSESETKIRADEVKRAFNSPFWPRVLVTTSIGQEGLDMHPWCDALLHWDLAANPVSMEQREGRITRFAGLNVRRAMALDWLSAGGQMVCGSSPWAKLASAKEAEYGGGEGNGLSPWWVYPGSSPRHWVVGTLGSEQFVQHKYMQKQRAIYRLVLGMPNPEHLLQLLHKNLKGQEDAMSELAVFCVDLRP
ncbi:DEAD/DEAH box helicase [Hydrogenophaga pseudoflava]|uniref:DEAD/DEAH box helicase n=1 Tax=Hydrogenophaga pseudoflava TaxID=47421 RepID=UPI000A4124E9|nr:DEAD/DEAH box helicase family protein [Hydrogenophaga pseudoflava]